MKKIISLMLIITIFMTIIMAIVPTVQAATDNKVSTSASIVPANGLEPDEETPNPSASSTALPKTGLTNMVVIAIVVVSLVGVGSFIRAKSIKID